MEKWWNYTLKYWVYKYLFSIQIHCRLWMKRPQLWRILLYTSWPFQKNDMLLKYHDIQEQSKSPCKFSLLQKLVPLNENAVLYSLIRDKNRKKNYIALSQFLSIKLWIICNMCSHLYRPYLAITWHYLYNFHTEFTDITTRHSL